LPNETELFSGNNLCLHENGNNKTKGEIKEGKLHGNLIMWYKNGQIQIETLFAEGKPVDGKVSSWEENGKKILTGSFDFILPGINNIYSFDEENYDGKIY
jgi:antitoxin component YwqK of YwqJK toxin-antitoxin module